MQERDLFTASGPSHEKVSQLLNATPTGSRKGPRKKSKTRKGDYARKLEEENQMLHGLIVEIQQKISSLEAQNDVLQQQLGYFTQVIPKPNPEDSGSTK